MNKINQKYNTKKKMNITLGFSTAGGDGDRDFSDVFLNTTSFEEDVDDFTIFGILNLNFLFN